MRRSFLKVALNSSNFQEVMLEWFGDGSFRPYSL